MNENNMNPFNNQLNNNPFNNGFNNTPGQNGMMNNQVAQPMQAQPMQQQSNNGQQQFIQNNQSSFDLNTMSMQKMAPNNPFQNATQFNVNTVHEINPYVNNPVDNNQSDGGSTSTMNKNVSRGLLVVMLIIFGILGGSIFYVTKDEQELTCTYESSNYDVNYKFEYVYKFKNNRLRSESIRFTTDLGSYYDEAVDEYLKEIRKDYVDYIDTGYDYDLQKKSPIVDVSLYGEGRTMLKYHEFNSFVEAPDYESVKNNARDNDFTCK